jgi:hypothetical protein
MNNLSFKASVVGFLLNKNFITPLLFKSLFDMKSTNDDKITAPYRTINLFKNTQTLFLGKQNGIFNVIAVIRSVIFIIIQYNDKKLETLQENAHP